MKKFSLFFAVILIVVLTACAKTTLQNQEPLKAPETSPNTESAMKFDQTALPQKGDQIVVMKTSKFNKIRKIVLLK